MAQMPPPENERRGGVEHMTTGLLNRTEKLRGKGTCEGANDYHDNGYHAPVSDGS